MRIRLALVLLAVGLSHPAVADDEGWEHARSAGGVQVFTREVPGSAFREFRATHTIPASMREVVAWWHDPATFTRWIDSCVEAHRVDAGEGIDASYLKFDFPFPASDRDVVLRSVEIERGPEHIVLESQSLDGVFPAAKGLVRMPRLRGRWEFRALDDATTAVVYRQHMDAGGRLPGFIVNRVTVDNPIGTLLGLARFAESQTPP